MCSQRLFLPKKEAQSERPIQYKIEMAFTLKPHEYEFHLGLVLGWYFEKHKDFFGPSSRSMKGTANYIGLEYNLNILEETVLKFMYGNYSVYELGLKIIHKDMPFTDAMMMNSVIQEKDITKEAAIEIFQKWKNTLIDEIQPYIEKEKTFSCRIM